MDTAVTPAPITLDFRVIPIGDISPDPAQPRKKKNEAADRELAASMRICLLQPIVVRPTGNGQYIIINGERRWRAAQTIEWTTIPCMVADGQIENGPALQLIENVQRDDLCPEDISQHLRKLAEQLQQDDRPSTVRALATLVGKSTGWVSGKLTLSQLPEPIQALRAGKTVKNSRTLIGLARLHDENPAAAAALIEQIHSGQPVTSGQISRKRKEARESGPSDATPSAVSAPAAASSPEPPTTPPWTTATPEAQEATPISPGPRPRRRKVISEAARLIGLDDNLPEDELLEALASAVLQLKGVPEPE